MSLDNFIDGHSLYRLTNSEYSHVTVHIVLLLGTNTVYVREYIEITINGMLHKGFRSMLFVYITLRHSSAPPHQPPFIGLSAASKSNIIIIIVTFCATYEAETEVGPVVNNSI